MDIHSLESMLKQFWGEGSVEATPDHIRRTFDATSCGFGQNFSHFWWDAPQGLMLMTPKNPPIGVSFVFGPNSICLVQVQTAEQRATWLRDEDQTVSPRVKVLKVLLRASSALGFAIAAQDGEQKVREILELHGGFSIKEHEQMEWAEWGGGKEVVAHLRRVYDKLPQSFVFGEAVTFELTQARWIVGKELHCFANRNLQ